MFFASCDPDRENLSLYSNADGSWVVSLPAEEVPPELPEPALGINFARDGMKRGDWLALVAVHSDAWLMSVAFYYSAKFSAEQRKKLFDLINSLPTTYEVLSGKGGKKMKVSVVAAKKRRTGRFFFASSFSFLFPNEMNASCVFVRFFFSLPLCWCWFLLFFLKRSFLKQGTCNRKFLVLTTACFVSVSLSLFTQVATAANNNKRSAAAMVRLEFMFVFADKTSRARLF